MTDTALLGLGISLLGTLVVSTWRLASLASRLLAATERNDASARELKERTAKLDSLPVIEQRLSHLEKNHSLIPKAMARLDVIEAKLEHSKEMRRAMYRSRPEVDEENS